MEKGKLIVIEGACDGVGKSTQKDLLVERFNEEGIYAIDHHFHSRGFDEGQLAQNYLDEKYGKLGSYSAEWVNNLFAVDRQIIWPTKLKPEYDKGAIVLLDRYISSSLIYQGAMKETREELIELVKYAEHFEHEILGIIRPDHILFLYADFEAAMKLKKSLLNKTGQKADMHEKDIAYMRKVYDTAMFLAEYLNWTMVKCDDENGIKSVEEIHEDVYARVKEMIKK